MKTVAKTLAMGLLLVTVALMACAQAKPTQKFTLRIGVLPIVDSLPYFVMLDEGFASQHGIQLEEQSYSSGEVCIEAISAGSADMGYPVETIAVLRAFEHGLIPSKVIPVAASSFADPENPNVGLLVAPSVDEWLDLKGQFIAIPALVAPSTTAIIGRLHLEGVYDYELVEISYANMGLSVAGGNVSAAALTEPFMTQSLLRDDGRLLDWIIGGSPLKYLENGTIVFSADVCQSNPEAVKAFLRAYLDAVNWIDQNPDDARSILGQRLNLSVEVTQKVKLPLWSLDGHNDPYLLEYMQPVMIGAGMIETQIPASQLYDETLLNEVLSEKKDKKTELAE